MPLKAPTRRMPRAYNLALEEIKNQQRELYERAIWLRDHQKVVNEVYRRFQAAMDAEIIQADPSVYCCHQGGSAYAVVIRAMLRDLPGFNCPDLMALLELFHDADKIESKDFAQYLNREYTFTYKIGDSEHKIMVYIDAWVKDGSPTCRRVLKEVKLVTREEKVYDMVCDPIAEVTK